MVVLFNQLQRVLEFPRWVKMLILVSLDMLLVILSYYVILAFLNKSLWPYESLMAVSSSVLDFMILLPLSFNVFGLYRHMIRHASIDLLIEVIKGVTLTVVLAKFISFAFFNNEFSDRFLMELWLLLILGTLGIRLFAKKILQSGQPKVRRAKSAIAIFGAGEAGVALFNAFERNTEKQVVAFFDDKEHLDKRRIKGCAIYHASRMREVIKEKNISEIVVAIPSLPNYQRENLLNRLEALGIHVLTLPSFDEILDGRIDLSQIRDFKAEEVLNRKSHIANETLIEKDVQGKCVMVTGGGGSIGSELCRQVCRHGASSLIIFENTEYALYSIEQELLAMAIKLNSPIKIVPVLGDVCNKDLVGRILKEFNCSTIYHAAAYKHVPMLETNVCEGVRNNTFGTISIALAAKNNNVDKLVLISTDKAVRPTNVMGASKRLAEIVLQALQDEASATVMTIVRFGNVLDSAGSVVPLFRKQIRDGGPITLTHKDVTRYFMTIPEAAQLVLQAGAMAKGGEVYLLDMGSPVKIYDLAEKMIKLSGLSVRNEGDPDGDIEISITGLRPGEKLHEELFLTDNVKQTAHSSIMCANEDYMPWDQLRDELNNLRSFISANEEASVLKSLEKLVEGFQYQ